MTGFCLVGGGFIGPLHAANIAAHPEPSSSGSSTSTSGGDPTCVPARSEAEPPNLDDALADPRVGAVMICTPPRTHAAIIERARAPARRSFARSRWTWTSSASMRARRCWIRRACPSSWPSTGGSIPATGRCTTRSAPETSDARDARAVEPRSRNLAPDYVAAMPFGIFYDTMIHDFDMVRWLLAEEPVEITARTACMLDEKENPHRDPDTAMVMLTMESGALVHVNSSFRAVYGYDQRIEAFGSDGMLISRNHQPTALERYDAQGVRQDPLLRFFIERYAESYRRELDDFIRAVETGAPVDRLRDGRRALEIAEAAVASAKSGTAINARMNRRDFLGGVLAVLALPGGLRAGRPHPQDRVARAQRLDGKSRHLPASAGCRGWVQGTTYALEYRSGEGRSRGSLR
jgi:myo-inositol 2-dehydrogenase/D-chiro-inositol 1-dehydrogenase